MPENKPPPDPLDELLKLKSERAFDEKRNKVFEDAKNEIDLLRLKAAFYKFVVASAAIVGLGVMLLPPGCDQMKKWTKKDDGHPAAVTPEAAAEQMSAEIVENSRKLKVGFKGIQQKLKEYDADRADWSKFDATVVDLREMNKKLLLTSKAIVELYDAECKVPLDVLKRRLTDVVPKYREAADKFRVLASAENGAVQQSRYSQAEMCEGLARKAEQRLADLFSPTAKEAVSAATLEDAVGQLRKMVGVHQDWEWIYKVHFDATNGAKVIELQAELARYSEKLATYSTLVDRFNRTLQDDTLSLPPPVPPKEEKK